MRIVVVPDKFFPQEHHATGVSFLAWHPFFPWLYRTWFGRLLGLDPAKCFTVVRGRAIMRTPNECVLFGGHTLYCTARFKRELGASLLPTPRYAVNPIYAPSPFNLRGPFI